MCASCWKNLASFLEWISSVRWHVACHVGSLLWKSHLKSSLTKLHHTLVILKMQRNFFNFVCCNMPWSSLSLHILTLFRFMALLGFAYISALLCLGFPHFEGHFCESQHTLLRSCVSQRLFLFSYKQDVPVQVNKDHSTKPGWLGDHNYAKVYLHWLLCSSLY